MRIHAVKRVNSSAFFSKLVSFALIFLSLTLTGFSSRASTNTGITYQGRILKPDGSPLSGSNVQFKLQIRTPDNNNCLMYEEIQSLDMHASNGVFALTLADGSVGRTDSSGYPLDRIFANSQGPANVFTFNPATCTSGNSYSANSSDGRSLVVSFKDETMSTYEPMPTQRINSVPFAFEAKQLAGFTPASLVRVAESDGTLDTVSPLSNANYTELLALIGGTSAQYTKQSATAGSIISSASGNVASPSAGSVWLDTAAGNLKFYDGSVVKTVGTSGGSVTSVATGTGLTGGPITSTGTIALATVGSGGTGYKVTYDTFGRVTAAVALVEADIPTLSTAGKVIGSAITSGTIGGTTAVNTSGTISSGAITSSGLISSPSLTSAAIGTQSVQVFETTNSFKVTIQAPASLGANYAITLPTTAGLSGQFLTTNGAGVTSWTTGLTAATAFVNGGNAFGATSNIGNNDNFDLNLKTNNLPRMTVTAAGNVGIGTTAPSAALHLKAGTTAAATAPFKLTTGVLMATPEDGAMEYASSALYYTVGTTRYVIPLNASAGNFSSVSTISNSSGSITMSPMAGNSVIVNSSTVSTSSSTGALIVNGGAGIGGALNASGNIMSGGSVTATTNMVSPQIYGSSAASGNIKIDGTSNVAPGNVLLATAGGNVGIGTTSPSNLLTVVGGDALINGITVGRGGFNGGQNVALGAGALLSNVSGTWNTAVGENAGRNLTTGQNTAVGRNSVFGATTGGFITALGYNAVQYNNGGGNTGVGYGAIGNVPGSTGGSNSAFGSNTLSSLTSGGSNVALGVSAGYDITTGSNNVIVGAFSSGTGVTTGSNNILVGNDVRAPSNTASNQLNIGNLIYATGLASGTTASSGNVGIGTTSPSAPIDVVSTSTLAAGQNFGASISPTFVNSGTAGYTAFKVNSTETSAGSGQNYLMDLQFNGTAKFNVNRYGGFMASSVSTIWGGLNLKGSALSGDTAVSGNLTLDSTSNVTKGYVILQPTSGNVGIGTTAPAEKLDVSGGVKLGNTAGANAGTLRWTGTNFQGYDGSAWNNILPNPPSAGGCDSTQTFNSTGVQSYTVPASYGTITIKLWGGGGGGGAGWNANGGAGGTTSIGSLSLSAGGGGGGLGGALGRSGGVGGAASGGSINTNGAAGGNGGGSTVPSGSGGSSPFGGTGGGNCPGVANAGGSPGGAPGGGGGGGCDNGGSESGGGGGSGAYVEKTFTSATLPASTTINDIVVGAAGAYGNSTGSGANGAVGRVTVTCSSTGSPPVNNRSIVFQNSGAYSASTTFIYDASGNVGIGTTAPQAMLDINGQIRLKSNSSAPVACSAGVAGTIALTSTYVSCVCNGTSWVRSSDGSTACTW